MAQFLRNMSKREIEKLLREEHIHFRIVEVDEDPGLPIDIAPRPLVFSRKHNNYRHRPMIVFLHRRLKLVTDVDTGGIWISVLDE